MTASPVVLAAILALLATSAGAAETSAKADDLIAAAKAAMGGDAWDRIVTWRESDQVTIGGLSGTAESVVDLRTLANRSHFRVGPVSGAAGWDGKQAWTVDDSGEVRIESSGEAIGAALRDAYRGTWGYFFPARHPSVREDAGSRTADGQTYEAVKITPLGGEPFEVWFDPATHLVEREVLLTGEQSASFIFSDYTRYGAILVPSREIDRVGDDTRYDTVAQVAAISFAGPEGADRYGPPPPPPNSALWPAATDSVTLPFRLVNNHIYIDASIDASPSTPFVFDTGSTNMLETRAARRLGIAVEGALPGGGFGDKLEDVGLARIRTVSLGGLTLPDQVFAVAASPDWSEGPASSGLLGYDFAKRAVVTIDYAGRTMTFTKPAAFRPPQGAAGLPFAFAGHMPMVSGSLDGVSGEFEIDTGSPGGLILMRPFADAHGLADRYHATRAVTLGYGLGGPSRALLARAGALTLGPVTISAPVTEILIDKAGAAQAARTAGNIGGDLLKRFTVTLDYGRRTVWLAPNSLAGQAEVFDRSGLSLGRLADGRFVVGEVTALSAAAEAGILPGEAIVSVGGRPARSIALFDLLEEFKGPVGARFDLRVRGKGGERAVTLILADQV